MGADRGSGIQRGREEGHTALSYPALPEPLLELWLRQRHMSAQSAELLGSWGRVRLESDCEADDLFRSLGRTHGGRRHGASCHALSEWVAGPLCEVSAVTPESRPDVAAAGAQFAKKLRFAEIKFGSLFDVSADCYNRDILEGGTLINPPIFGLQGGDGRAERRLDAQVETELTYEP